MTGEFLKRADNVSAIVTTFLVVGLVTGIITVGLDGVDADGFISGGGGKEATVGGELEGGDGELVAG